MILEAFADPRKMVHQWDAQRLQQPAVTYAGTLQKLR